MTILRILLVLVWFLPASVNAQTTDSLKVPESVKTAFELSNSTGKSTILYFKGTCDNDIKTQSFIRDNEIELLLNEQFHFVELSIEDRTPLASAQHFRSPALINIVATAGQKHLAYEIEAFEQRVQPFFVILDSNQQVLASSKYLQSTETMKDFLLSVLK